MSVGAVFQFTPKGVRHAVVVITVGKVRGGGTRWTNVARLACDQGYAPQLDLVVDGTETCKRCCRVYTLRAPVAAMHTKLAEVVVVADGERGEGR